MLKIYDMKYTLGILMDKVDLLEMSYIKYVKNGNVSKNSNAAIDNRVKCRELKEAIEVLINHNTVK